MEITIMSCDREPSYLSETIDHLGLGHSIKIVHQGQPSEKTKAITRNIPRVSIEVTERPFDKDVQLNARYNYIQTLSFSQSNLILEDDVKASKNFNYRMAEIKSLLKQFGKRRYILALYSCYWWGNATRSDKPQQGLVEYPLKAFYGTQAMYIDKTTRKLLAEYIKENIQVAPYDMLIKDFCRETGTPLLASRYSLFQHIGQVTTGLGSFHKCPNFIDAFSL